MRCHHAGRICHHFKITNSERRHKIHMIKSVYTKDAPAAIGPYSQAIQCGDMVFLSGQIPIIPETGKLVEGNIVQQTEQVMKNIKNILSAAGTDFTKVIKTTCFLADINDFDAFNSVYGKYLTSKPARSCVSVKALPKGALVEVEAVAAL